MENDRPHWHQKIIDIGGIPEMNALLENFGLSEKQTERIREQGRGNEQKTNEKKHFLCHR